MLSGLASRSVIIPRQVGFRLASLDRLDGYRGPVGSYLGHDVADLVAVVAHRDSVGAVYQQMGACPAAAFTLPDRWHERRRQMRRSHCVPIARRPWSPRILIYTLFLRGNPGAIVSRGRLRVTSRTTRTGVHKPLRGRFHGMVITSAWRWTLLLVCRSAVLKEILSCWLVPESRHVFAPAAWQ